MADLESHPQPPTHLELDATAVKVLAHPLRARVLSELRRNGPASATTLAAALQTNTGATSYHLRKLAEVGLVADTGDGRGKERIWRAATDSHGWANSAFADDEDARAALGWLVRSYHRDFDQKYAAWLDVADSWPAAWQDVSGMNDLWVEVTPEQAQRLSGELDALLNRYRRLGSGDPRARRLHLYRFAFPVDPTEVPDDPA
ncbi:MAG: helix-turn-helix domain-containing protein [Propionicimonas sp.]